MMHILRTPAILSRHIRQIHVSCLIDKDFRRIGSDTTSELLRNEIEIGGFSPESDHIEEMVS